MSESCSQEEEQVEQVDRNLVEIEYMIAQSKAQRLGLFTSVTVGTSQDLTTTAITTQLTSPKVEESFHVKNPFESLAITFSIQDFIGSQQVVPALGNTADNSEQHSDKEESFGLF